MSLNCNRHRAVMAMAAAGVLTALATSTPAFAAPTTETSEPQIVAGAPNAVVVNTGLTSAMGDKVVEMAYQELNSDRTLETPMGSNCNYYSKVWNKPCQAWCADFTKVVWKNAGVYDWQRLDSEAGTTARWARTYGRWHAGTAGIIPGAAVTYNSSGDPFVDSDHVGTFVGWVNGQPKVVSGNFNNQVYKHNLSYGTPIAGWADPS
ncbi:hypothetical protein F4553_002130 [Allocatelliglobosispora scoriae]|uniref:CHAP domain-containing protein n=1 Tax=Allocatelliglobosispora scoriae TaxID=643052 RepID=A0A841BPJ5_9ACTN|nr:hypothetical protein [Allocatelliglobosispora scoriae]MBB5868751.1 hypothetical protein [Allocatelliglobosispora scoriae]